MFNFFWYLDFFLMPCYLRLTHGLAQRLAHNRGRAVQIRTTETMAHAQFDFARFWRPICQSRHLKLQSLQMNLGVENPTSWQKTPKNRCGLNWAPAMPHCVFLCPFPNLEMHLLTQVYMCTSVNTVCAALPGSGMEKVPLPQQTQVRNNIGNPPQMIDTCLVTKYSSGF